MGVLDKFLNIMKLDDDYDEEEDFLGEEEEFEEYEPKPKKSLFKKKNMKILICRKTTEENQLP